MMLYLIGTDARTDESTSCALLSVAHTAGRIVMTHQRCGVREQGSLRIAKHEQQPEWMLDTSVMICIVCSSSSSVHVSMMYIFTGRFLPDRE
jgi:hypothetical protein